MAGKADQPGDSTWPLGAFLRDQRARMSIREAARRADISESRWRQVEAGVQKMGGGIEVPVYPRPETVAAMCRAVAADVKRGLELAGHDPAQYEWLVTPAESVPDGATLDWFTGLPRDEREAVLAEMQRAHVDTELRQRGVAPPPGPRRAV